MISSATHMQPEGEGLALCSSSSSGPGTACKAPFFDRAPRDQALPMSFAQERLWLIHQFDNSGVQNNLGIAVRLKGEINLAALQGSLSALVARHESMRTNLDLKDGMPVQIIRAEASFEFSQYMAAVGSDEPIKERVERILAEQFNRAFDLRNDPLFRVALVHLNSEEQVLMLTLHSTIADAWSIGIFVSEISAFYRAAVEARSCVLPELWLQYADFAVWQRYWLQGEALQQALGYWRRQLEGAPAHLRLPWDNPRPPAQTSAGVAVKFHLSTDLCDCLRDLARKERATIFMVLIAAFQTLLYRYSRQSDFVVGVPVIGRGHRPMKGVTGPFENALPMRAGFAGRPTFREALKRTRAVVMEAYLHQDLPFAKIAEEFKAYGDLGRHPVFQVMFRWDESPLPEWRLGNVEVEPFPTPSTSSRVDLSLRMRDDNGQLRGEFLYTPDLSGKATIEIMAGHFQRLLESVLDPGQPVHEISFLNPSEAENLCYQTAALPATEWQGSTIDQMIAIRAEQNPGSEAIVADGIKLSYSELNRQVDGIAERLHSYAVRPGEAVGVYIEPSAQLLASVLGVLRAGAVFVPLDVKDPVARTAFILRDAEVVAILATEDTSKKLPDGLAKLIVLDPRTTKEDEPVRLQATGGSTSPDSIAGILYRSSSSGCPQGIIIGHRTLWPRALPVSMEARAPLRVAHDFKFSNETSCFEALRAVAEGAAVVKIPGDRPLPPLRFARFLQDQGITVLFTSGSMIGHLGRDFPQALAEVRLMFCDDGPTALDDFQEATKPEILNRIHVLHGWTEAGGGQMLFHPFRPGSHPNIASGARLRIVDDYLCPTPDGMIGELAIPADALALGYRDQLEIMQSPSFVKAAGQRLFRTGDLVRRRPDGGLQHYGRNDGRCLVQGVRVHCEEIEAVLRKHPHVEDVAVACTGTPPALVSLILPAQDQSPRTEQLQSFLREQLPEIMVPAVFVLTEAIPRRTDGQLDREQIVRKAGLSNSGDRALMAYVAPRNETEEGLVRIWAGAFGIEKIGVHDNFFSLGGDSLLAVRVIAQINPEFKTNLLLRDLFELPTVAALGTKLQQGAKSSSGSKPLQLRTEYGKSCGLESSV